ncbi:MAG: hypothetical protein N2439_04430 [Anaerolineae bacterium]|nr:hypothetical protein [Anaerolineae bacterium]
MTPEAGWDAAEAQTAEFRAWLSEGRAATPKPNGGAEADEPLDLRDAVPWPAPLHESAFHGPAGDFVRLVSPTSEADPAALLAQFLAFAGCWLGPLAWVEADGSRLRANLSILVVGRSAKARKGTSFNQVERFFRLVDEEFCDRNVASGLVSGEGVIHRVRDGDGREDEGIADKRLLVFEPEFAGVLAIADRKGNTLTATLRDAWDGRSLQILSRNCPIRATRPHIAFIGHITKADLAAGATGPHIGNGFLNRHLFICAKRARLLPDGGAPPWARLEALARVVKENLAAVANAGTTARDTEAAEAWRELYAALAGEDDGGMAGALLARAEAHVTKLGLIYAALDGSREIRIEHLAAAAAVWEYAANSVRHLFQGLPGDPEAARALEFIRAASDGGVTATDLHHLFQRHLPKDRIRSILRALIADGLVREEREPSPGRGRPAQRFVAIRAPEAKCDD